MRTTPVKHLYDVRDDRAGDGADLPLLSVSISRGVVPRSELVDGDPRADDLSNYKRCSPDDIVINRMSAYQGAVGISRHEGVVSPDYLVLRPRSGTEPRFLSYLIRSAWFVGEMTSRVRGIGSTEQGNVRTPRINPSDLGGIVVVLPSLPGQRAIADYLDTETARIDALIAKKARLSDVVETRFRSWAEGRLLERAVRQVPLMYLTQVSRPIVYGIVQAGPHVSEGVPYLKSGDVTNLKVSSLSRTSLEIDEQYRRARVQPGDIVMAMRASIGRVMTVPDELRRANLTQGTARIAAAPGVSRRWLYHVLRTDYVQAQCQVRAVGTTFKTLNIWDLRRIVVPVIEHSEQIALAQEIDEREGDKDRLSATLQRQVSLLREHREALITAAVTGELDIPGVG